MRVISRAKEKLAPVVQVVREELAGLLKGVIANPQSPTFNHYLFECIAALIGCASAAGGPQVIFVIFFWKFSDFLIVLFFFQAVSSMEASLMPMFGAILQQNIDEFSGYVYQLLSQLLGEQTDVPESYWASFAGLMAFAAWEKVFAVSF